MTCEHTSPGPVVVDLAGSTTKCLFCEYNSTVKRLSEMEEVAKTLADFARSAPGRLPTHIETAVEAAGGSWIGWMERKATWADDAPIPEDDAIHDAHPLRTGRHDVYQEARRLVGAKRSKIALINLVNWLLLKNQGK